jgi:hypothetical protein
MMAPAPTRTTCDRVQIADGIVGVRREIPLPVDHLREAPEVVVDILRPIGMECRRQSRQYHHRDDTTESDEKPASACHLYLLQNLGHRERTPV